MGEIRRQGMQVGEAFATIMGEELVFEEIGKEQRQIEEEEGKLWRGMEEMKEMIRKKEEEEEEKKEGKEGIEEEDKEEGNEEKEEEEEEESEEDGFPSLSFSLDEIVDL